MWYLGPLGLQIPNGLKAVDYLPTIAFDQLIQLVYTLKIELSLLQGHSYSQLHNFVSGSFDTMSNCTSLPFDVVFVILGVYNFSLQAMAAIYSIHSHPQTSSILLQTADPLLETLDCTKILCWADPSPMASAYNTHQLDHKTQGKDIYSRKHHLLFALISYKLSRLAPLALVSWTHLQYPCIPHHHIWPILQSLPGIPWWPVDQHTGGLPHGLQYPPKCGLTSWPSQTQYIFFYTLLPGDKSQQSTVSYKWLQEWDNLKHSGMDKSCHGHRVIQHGVMTVELPTNMFNWASPTKVLSITEEVLKYFIDNQQADTMSLILARQAYPGTETVFVRKLNKVVLTRSNLSIFQQCCILTQLIVIVYIMLCWMLYFVWYKSVFLTVQSL